ncbi:hypothetical protein [Hymenobacter arizonensis]|uniref:Ion channel n=1 Tax=Hymenobacter arizonensis TaxID=1227077 RepID=A0A1I5XP44_HYMAR|nr:hypothetical protein [Hymenobacter arizonensis]SFQ33721.1 hypothetical protein SAMN04515668_1971 [Hymenobacter arizonensis]
MQHYLLGALRVIVGVSGTMLVVATVSSAIRAFILPRNEVVRLNVWVFVGVRTLFDAAAKLANSYDRRDRIMAHYAPVALVALPVVWEALVSLGYTGIYWALGEGSWYYCYRLSNNSLLTLGSFSTTNMPAAALTYSEATLGLLLLTLLLSYLPTIYQAFSRRETTVTRIELRAGTPASAATLLCWLNNSGSLQDDDAQWEQWEQWFVEIEESHTSLPILTFFRSPQPGRSWVIAAGLLLETANLFFSALDEPRPRQAELTFKAGCVALNRVYRFFSEQAGTEPRALLPEESPVREAERADFDKHCDALVAAGLPVRSDRDAAWVHYQELRNRYVSALDFLATLTMAPKSKPL